VRFEILDRIECDQSAISAPVMVFHEEPEMVLGELTVPADRYQIARLLDWAGSATHSYEWAIVCSGRTSGLGFAGYLPPGDHETGLRTAMSRGPCPSQPARRYQSLRWGSAARRLLRQYREVNTLVWRSERNCNDLGFAGRSTPSCRSATGWRVGPKSHPSTTTWAATHSSTACTGATAHSSPRWRPR